MSYKYWPFSLYKTCSSASRAVDDAGRLVARALRWETMAWPLPDPLSGFWQDPRTYDEQSVINLIRLHDYKKNKTETASVLKLPRVLSMSL